MILSVSEGQDGSRDRGVLNILPLAARDRRSIQPSLTLKVFGIKLFHSDDEFGSHRGTRRYACSV